MDNFSEQLIKRNETSADKTKRVALVTVGIFLTVLFVAVGILFIGTAFSLVGFLLAVVIGYGTFFFVQSTYVEYEYTFTNGELDIDKIVAKKKRSSLLSVEVRKFTDFGKYTDSTEETDDMTVVMSSDNIESHEYYADFQHEDYGKTRLVFAPDDRMLENIKYSLPARLRNKI